MSVIEFAERRLIVEDEAGEYHNARYWAAYLDGARAQKREDEMLQKENDLKEVVKNGRYK